MSNHQLFLPGFFYATAGDHWTDALLTQKKEVKTWACYLDDGGYYADIELTDGDFLRHVPTAVLEDIDRIEDVESLYDAGAKLLDNYLEM